MLGIQLFIQIYFDGMCKVSLLHKTFSCPKTTFTSETTFMKASNKTSFRIGLSINDELERKLKIFYFLYFVCSWRKEIGYPVITDFASRLGFRAGVDGNVSFQVNSGKRTRVPISLGIVKS